MCAFALLDAPVQKTNTRSGSPRAVAPLCEKVRPCLVVRCFTFNVAHLSYQRVCFFAEAARDVSGRRSKVHLSSNVVK